MAVNWMNSIGTKFFLIIETVLYLSFLSLDINGFFAFSAYIKYLSITILFVFVLVKSIHMKRSFLIPVALGFSVFADYFLLFTSSYIPGLLAFLVVQVMLFFRIQKLFSISIMYRVGMLIFLFVLGSTSFTSLHLEFDVVTALAMIYFLCFLNNVVTVIFTMNISQYWKDKTCYFFPIGLILFFFCDIHVGIYNLTSYVSDISKIFNKYYGWFTIAMWLFYLPGQMLIGLSNILEEKITCKSTNKMI